MSWAFLRTPRWLAAHVLALAGIVLFCSLGVWQLERLEERRSYNAAIEAGARAAPLPLAEVLNAPAAATFRRAIVRGRYLTGGEALLAGRTRAGRPGHEVLTPLQAGDGTVVIVNRGWVPFELDTAPVVPAAPPTGVVEVTGVVRAGQRTGTFLRPRPPADSDLYPAVDLELFTQRLGRPVAPVWLQAVAQDPPGPNELPVPVQPAGLGEGNHLSYAVQWFLFAAVVTVGYPLLLRRHAQPGRGGEPGPASQPVDAGPARLRD